MTALDEMREHFGPMIDRTSLDPCHYEGCWKDHWVCAVSRLLDACDRSQPSAIPPTSNQYLTRTFWSPDRRHLVTAHFTGNDIVTLQDDNGKEWESTGATIHMEDVPRPAVERATDDYQDLADTITELRELSGTLVFHKDTFKRARAAMSDAAHYLTELQERRAGERNCNQAVAVYAATLSEIANYQGNYATDKNPTIRAIKRIANDALNAARPAPETPTFPAGFPPMEVLDAIAFEHRDSDKCYRARMQLAEWLRSRVKSSGDAT